MNDDLHHIDDLFRDGIERHEESVPASVWEAVNNDLDKKQVSCYQRKYRRLKRVVFFLLSLCFLGGAYTAYDVLNNQHIAVVPTSGGTKRPVVSSKVKKSDVSGTFPLTAGLPAPVPQKQTGIAGNGAVSNSSSPEWVKAQANKKETKDGITQEGDEKKHRLATTTLHVTQKGKGELVQETNPVSLRGTTQRTVAMQTAPSASLLFPIRQFSLLNMHGNLLTNSLQTLNRGSVSSIPPGSTDYTVKRNSEHRLSVSACIAPNVSFDRLRDNDRLAGPGRNRRDAHREEVDNLSFSGGMLLTYELTKNLGIQSGISFTSSITSIAEKTVYAKADNNGHFHYEFNCSSGFAYFSPKGGIQPAAGDSATASGTTSKLTYISMPVLLQYRISLGRFSLAPFVGAGINFLAGDKTTTRLSSAGGTESASASISGLKKNYIDGQIGFGVEYSLYQNVSIGIRPNARLALTPINNETPVRSYQNFLSLESIIRFRF